MRGRPNVDTRFTAPRKKLLLRFYNEGSRTMACLTDPAAFLRDAGYIAEKPLGSGRYMITPSGIGMAKAIEARRANG